jgi:phosphoglucosamine mutase
MRKLFGTDGVRGLANVEPMTPEMAMKLGRVAAHIFQNKPGRHRIVIGKDTRRSGYMLESALTAGICSMGVDVLLVGPMPTPAIAFLTRSFRADAGVMISASHNPFADNGIKFFSRDGFKLPDAVELKMEQMIGSGECDAIRPTAEAIGKVRRIDDVEGRYIEFVKNSLPKGCDFQGMKVVIDCAHGAAYKVAPTALRELGVEVVVLGDAPNGVNINADCGAVHPGTLQKSVVAHQAQLGIAYDGDADRAIFVDANGGLLDGDAVLAAFALDFHREGKLAQETVVATTLSNMGLEIALRAAGVCLLRADVGDRYVLEQMLKSGCNFGGEPSGHIVFLDHNYTGDGLISSLQFLLLMQKTGKSARQIAECMTLLPQVSLNVPVAKKIPFPDIPGMEKAMADCEKKLADRGRLLVRYSGTEALLRIMVEGEDLAGITAMADRLAEPVLKVAHGRKAP